MLWDRCTFCWWKKEGRILFNILCLRVYQFKRITWWRLSVLESVLKYALQYVMLEIILKKSHVLLEFALHPPLGGGPNANPSKPCTFIHNLPCRTPCRLFIHELFFGPLGLHLLVWSELGWSPPFRPMRALTLPWSKAFSLVCETAPRLIASRSHFAYAFASKPHDMECRCKDEPHLCDQLDKKVTS